MKTSYVVTEKTANLLDCIRLSNQLYNAIYDSLAAIYGDDATDKGLILPYDRELSNIQKLLYDSLKDQINQGLEKDEGLNI